MSTQGKHRSNLSGSKRLQRVLDALIGAGKRGLTTWELMHRARVTDPKDVIYELRCQGLAITSERVRVGDATVARYALEG